MLKIYLAGPDVFELNASEIGRHYQKKCNEYGFEGLFPLDNDITVCAKKEVAQQIYQQNLELIKQADVVLANLNAFRGHEPDSGTVWECGYAKGLNIPVFAYIDSNTTYINRFSSHEKQLLAQGWADQNYRLIEDFDHPLNLMIMGACEQVFCGNFEQALKKLAKIKHCFPEFDELKKST